MTLLLYDIFMTINLRFFLWSKHQRSKFVKIYIFDYFQEINITFMHLFKFTETQNNTKNTRKLLRNDWNQFFINFYVPFVEFYKFKRECWRKAENGCEYWLYELRSWGDGENIWEFRKGHFWHLLPNTCLRQGTTRLTSKCHDSTL